ncbi:MAG: hypothetical protein ABJO01_00095 [Parasphingorhabdus sp.]|uniref:hypothetical protein n=1 Tax=Parasphingorhabdus sp. TaxID=2709688 RepID=UPI00329912BC
MAPLFTQAKLAILMIMIDGPYLVLAHAGHIAEPRFEADRTASVYRCENDMVLSLAFMTIDKLSLIKLTLPSKRSGKNSRDLLLPRSQSGSGVRYATDLISVHIKNDELVLRSRESAMTDKIAAARCVKI